VKFKVKLKKLGGNQGGRWWPAWVEVGTGGGGGGGRGPGTSSGVASVAVGQLRGADRRRQWCRRPGDDRLGGVDRCRWMTWCGRLSAEVEVGGGVDSGQASSSLAGDMRR
jgi:hypothetical protein